MLFENQIHETYKVLGLTAMCSMGGEHKIAWAMRLLEQDIESEAVAILAGISNPINEFEVDEYFIKALSDLSIERPPYAEALWGYTKAVATEVINGVQSPDEGVSLIYEIYICLNYPDQLSAFTELNDEWLCECIMGWSSDQRRAEIIKACDEVIHRTEYPRLSYKTESSERGERGT